MPDKEKIKACIEKDANIKEKSPDEQKRIIQAYIQKIVVYENTIDINTIVTFAGGGGLYLTVTKYIRHLPHK